jgi:hypothetical protein
VVLWSRAKLAADCGVQDPHTDGFDGIVIAQNLRSEREVDELVAAAEKAGAQITRPAAPTFYGGYAAVFRDPDGHAWEVAYDPGFTLTEDGSLVLLDFSPE